VYRSIDFRRQSCVSKWVSHVLPSPLKLARRIELDLGNELLSVLCEGSQFAVQGIVGVKEREGNRENVHVKVPRIVLSSRREWPNRFGKPIAVQDRADVSALLHRSDGTPVER